MIAFVGQMVIVFSCFWNPLPWTRQSIKSERWISPSISPFCTPTVPKSKYRVCPGESYCLSLISNRKQDHSLLWALKLKFSLRSYRNHSLRLLKRAPLIKLSPSNIESNRFFSLHNLPRCSASVSLQSLDEVCSAARARFIPET
jgi:hypothetical protein